MAIFTYLGRHEHDLPISNKIVKETLDELRKVSGELWVVHEHKWTTGKLWWKKDIYRYRVMVNTGGTEFQEINFYRSDSTNSINVFATAEMAVAFMYGYMGGYERGQQQLRYEEKMHVRSTN